MATESERRAENDPLGQITLTHLRGLPDGSLTKAEVNLLVDYIERLEAKLYGVASRDDGTAARSPTVPAGSSPMVSGRRLHSPDFLHWLASTVGYLLCEDGPYHDLDPTDLTIEYRFGWGVHPCDDEMYELGPTDISVVSGRDVFGSFPSAASRTNGPEDS